MQTSCWQRPTRMLTLSGHLSPGGPTVDAYVVSDICSGHEQRPQQTARLASRRSADSAFVSCARLETGVLLRRLQRGDSIGLPNSRPMPTIGPRCHELRVVDEDATWRVVYRIDTDAIVIADVFSKKTQATPKPVIDACIRRLRGYDAIVGEEE
jgi:phage-related protein